MAQTPMKGPMASGAKAQLQPAWSIHSGKSWTMIAVRAKPRAVCRVKSVPVHCGGLSSVMAAENCALSAMIDRPQSRSSGIISQGGAWKRRPARRAQLPEMPMEIMVMVVRPWRSAARPATRQPTAPMATTAKAVRLAAEAGPCRESQ